MKYINKIQLDGEHAENKGITLKKDPDGFTVIKNAKGIDTIDITWDYTWFYTGWLMSIISLIGLGIIIRRLPAEANEPHNPDNVEDYKSPERSRSQSRKKTQRIKKQKRNKYQKNH